MGIAINNHIFDGPYLNCNNLEPRPGVYVILDPVGWRIVDAGKADDVRAKVARHDRIACWNEETGWSWWAAAYYCDEPLRSELLAELERRHHPPCARA